MGLMRAGLTNESYDREYNNRVLLGRIAGYFRSRQGRLILIITLVSLLSFMGAAVPILVARGVEQIEQDLERDNFMSAEAAREYGLVDNVLEKRQQIADEDDD